MGKTLVVIGTLDTKGLEIAYLVDRIKKLSAGNIQILVVDSSMSGEPSNGIKPDIGRGEVARAGGESIEKIISAKSRGEAITLMEKGLTKTIYTLYENGQCDGVVSLAGASGGFLACAAMKALPIGVPKLIATPLASGPRTFSTFVGTKDIMIMHSVIDILGVNSISKIIYNQLAGAAVGAKNSATTKMSKNKNAIGVTMLGNTTEGVMHLKSFLEKLDYEVIVFHSSGIGGKAMEQFARDGFFCGVIDYTTNEVFEDIVGGLQRGAGPERLSVIGKLGLPQVIVPGCVDFFDQGPIDNIPEKWKNRKLYSHSPSFTLVRLTKDEMSNLGRIFAEKLNNSKGPTVVVFPLKGLSIPNCPGGVFEDKEADMAFLNTLRKNLRNDIKILEIDAHINDKFFAEEVSSTFIKIKEGRW